MSKIDMSFDAAEFIASTGDSDVEDIVDAAYEEGFEKAREYFAHMLDKWCLMNITNFQAAEFVRNIP